MMGMLIDEWRDKKIVVYSNTANDGKVLQCKLAEIPLMELLEGLMLKDLVISVEHIGGVQIP